MRTGEAKLSSQAARQQGLRNVNGDSSTSSAVPEHKKRVTHVQVGEQSKSKDK